MTPVCRCRRRERRESAAALPRVAPVFLRRCGPRCDVARTRS
jgi:hypothetical protein